MCGVVNKRKIPYGVINWAEIVRECLFVDNTRYILSRTASTSSSE